jgi:hypothetical protein
MSWQWELKQVSVWQKLKHFLRHGHRYKDGELVFGVPTHSQCRCQLERDLEEEQT